MFVNSDLQNHLNTSSTVKMNSLVIAEWNLNVSTNIDKIGNYRNRPNVDTDPFKTITNTYDPLDVSGWYTGATDSDVVLDNGVDANDLLLYSVTPEIKKRLLYSLEDCFYRFRPRSGINKIFVRDLAQPISTAASYINGTTDFAYTQQSQNMYKAPRYYPAGKNDKFKYWTSYRNESTTTSKTITKKYQTHLDYPYSESTTYPYSESTTTQDVVELVTRGISDDSLNIHDAAPFVVYNSSVPANRIVIKVQTNVGTIQGPAYVKDGKSETDPFFGIEKATVPKKWKIQYLNNSNNWADMKVFDGTENIKDVFSEDGYIELSYGLLNIPTAYEQNFVMAQEFATESLLPEESVIGYAYLIGASDNNAGTYYIYNGGTATDGLDQYGNYDKLPATYGWTKHSETYFGFSPFVTELTTDLAPKFTISGQTTYREFQNIHGLRIVVDTMNVKLATLDLIELSPRLVANISNITSSHSIKKIGSDLGVAGMPVGQLLASQGDITIFDYNDAFNINNSMSIIKSFPTNNLQIKFYEQILDVNGANYIIPLKALYADGFPEISNKDRQVKITLRDLFFYFESMIAPQIFLPKTSLSHALAALFDSIGFSNYVFYIGDGGKDPHIEDFFIAPDVSVAQVLNDLAISTQTAMFFDEYNNFVMMSKEYLIPDKEKDYPSRTINLYAESDVYNNKIQSNKTSSPIANIIDIASQNDEVFNDGKITYTSRYIQRSYSSVQDAGLVQDREKPWAYKPVLLWEVSPSEDTKSINDESGTQSNYILSAIVLNSILYGPNSEAPNNQSYLPEVVNGKVINNYIDFGSGAEWISRYNGYFCSNGEIIKYDAVQYNVPVESQKKYYITKVERYMNDNLVTDINAENNKLKFYASNDLKIDDTVNISGTISTQTNFEPINILDANNATVISATPDYFMISFPNIKSTMLPGTMGTVYLNETSVWVTSGQDYQNYFSKMPFNGKLFPSGKVRIFTEPIYNTDGTIKDGPVAKHGRGQFGTKIVEHSPNIEAAWLDNVGGIYMNFHLLTDNKYSYSSIRPTNLEPAGKIKNPENRLMRLGTVRDPFSSTFFKEGTDNTISNVSNGSIKSSALVLQGNNVTQNVANEKATDYVTYVYNPLDDVYKHYGTRMRLIGQPQTNNSLQLANGESTYYSKENIKTANNKVETVKISGSSGGIGIFVNPETNSGYYFEIAALTENSVINSGGNAENLNNMFFYKIDRLTATQDPDDATKTVSVGDPSTDSIKNVAAPIMLWSGMSQILVDNGKFMGQGRTNGETNPTVYDLSIEYAPDIDGNLRFFLYLNNKLVQEVIDKNPIGKTFKIIKDEDNSVFSIPDWQIVDKNVALFVRGNARAMFENVYAIDYNYALDPAQQVQINENSFISANTVSTSDALKKYSIPFVYKLFMESTDSNSAPKLKMYYNEFGTIMREMAYINARYDKAYPALISKLQPVLGGNLGYSTSNFTSTPYGAEFMIFNHTDFALSLDETTGNYLRISGITYTQQSQHELTVDDYFGEKGNLSNYDLASNTALLKNKKIFKTIKDSRSTYGKKEFAINAPFIQTQDAAKSLMDWLVNKIVNPRLSVGVQIFYNPTIQLGDLVTIHYDADATRFDGKKFVVYSIESSRQQDGPSMTVYLSEVI